MPLDQVIGALDQLHRLHLDLLEREREKKEKIIRNDLEALNAVSEQEAELIEQIAEAEQQRAAAVRAFLRAKGLHSRTNVTVSDLVKMVFRAEERQALTEARDRLTETLGELKRLNALNQQLLQQSLTMLEYSMDLIAGAPEEEGIYRHPVKQPAAPKRQRLYDLKA